MRYMVTYTITRLIFGLVPSYIFLAPPHDKPEDPLGRRWAAKIRVKVRAYIAYCQTRCRRYGSSHIRQPLKV